MAHLKNSDWGKIRSEPSEPKEEFHGDALKFENKNGDVIVFTLKEAKEVLQNYLHEELELFADEVAKNNRSKISERVEFKIKQIERGLLEHIDFKFLKIEEKIINATIDRMIEEEVQKRLEIKLKQIKDLL